MDSTKRLGEPVIGSHCFDAYYYQHCCGKPYVRNAEWLAFFGEVADRIVNDIRPARVLDAGCALGFLVETLRDRRVDAIGIDISTFAIEHVHEPVKPYCRVGSVTGDLRGPYDLIVAIELVEHMPASEAEVAIRNFCAQTDDILFSSTPFDFAEPTHVNIHPPHYWSEQFARHGFYRDVDYDATFITPWAVRFRKSLEPLHRVVRDYERRHWEMALEARGARAHSLELQSRLAVLEVELSRAKAAESELEAARAEMREVVAERDDLGLRLSQTLHTISNMERSRFWKARLLSVRLRERFR